MREKKTCATALKMTLQPIGSSFQSHLSEAQCHFAFPVHNKVNKNEQRVRLCKIKRDAGAKKSRSSVQHPLEQCSPSRRQEFEGFFTSRSGAFVWVQ